MSSKSKIILPGKNNTGSLTRTNVLPLNQRGFANIQEDILSQIFSLLARSFDEYDFDSEYGIIVKPKWDWVSVSEVCRYWHAVAIGNPKLWSYLENFDWTKRFQMSMRLSRNVELIVMFTIPGYSLDFDVEFGNLKIAMKEMGRIGHLELAAGFSEVQVAELLPYLELPAPRMHTLHILTSAFNISPHFHLPYTSTDVLRSVELFGFKSSLISGSSLSCLSDLTLDNCNFSLSQLSGLLNSCTALKELSIKSARIDPSDSSSINPARLPYLDKLHIFHEQIFIGFDILQMIEATNTSFYHVYFKGRLAAEDMGKLKALSNLLKEDDHVNKTIIRAKYMGAEVNDRMFNLDFTGYPGYLYLEFYQAERDAILWHFVDTFQSHLTKVSVLDVSVNRDAISSKTWRSLFSACISAKVLNISLEYDKLEEGVPLGALTRWPFFEELGGSLPDLEHIFLELAIGSAVNTERLVFDLKDVLERRLAIGLPVRKVTACSYYAESDCVLHNALEEIEILREWAEAVMIKKRDSDRDSMSSWDGRL